MELKNIILTHLSPLEALQDQQHLSKRKDQVDSQTVNPQTFLRNALKAKCFLPSSHSDVVLENKQICDEFNHLEPVQPSSFVSFSQELKENPAEEEQMSSSPEKLLEQSASTEPKAIPQPIPCQSQKLWINMINFQGEQAHEIHKGLCIRKLEDLVSGYNPVDATLWMQPYGWNPWMHLSGGSDTYLGDLVELNQSDTYISELDELNISRLILGQAERASSIFLAGLTTREAENG
ncbi:hypothetical protein F2Q68_00034288 [Brassica cretica]|uniref:Uncharacterized protein n=1 Tax=Brassica cretica TaxID=69181 RepID=A0A8S9H1J9_BRACR|nr:hypothetical protein F2Q68_00034288 [Brassica cretica]